MRGHNLVKPNYQFEKRQRELEKKRKQEEKRLRDLAAKNAPDSGSPADAAGGPESPEAENPATNS
jgi:hypothetical protein